VGVITGKRGTISRRRVGGNQVLWLGSVVGYLSIGTSVFLNRDMILYKDFLIE